MRIDRLSLASMALTAVTSFAAVAQEMPPIFVAEVPLPAPVAPAPVATAPTPPPQATPPQTQAQAAPAPVAPTYTQQQLDQMLAPIALYPDQLLGQILMASTYPLEVVDAARWLRDPANKALRGDALMRAMKTRNWDPSVMALVPFERVLDVMDSKLDWMRGVGAAFVSQQADVMAAVQRLRHLAMVAGTLKETPECHCKIATEGELITIAAVPAGPVCVPAYSSRVAYGHWPHASYPPVIFPVPYGVTFAPGLPVAFYPPVAIAWGGALWGWSSFDWHAGHILVDSGRYTVLAARDPHFAGGVWVHDPGRHGAIMAFGAAAAAHAGLAGSTGRFPVPFAAGAGGREFHGRAFHGREFHGEFHGRNFAAMGGDFRAGGRRGGGYAHAHNFAGGRSLARGGGHGGFAGHGGGHFGAMGHGGGHFAAAHFSPGGFGGHGGGHFGGGHFGGGPHGGGGHGGGGHGGGGHGGGGGHHH